MFPLFVFVFFSILSTLSKTKNPFNLFGVVLTSIFECCRLIGMAMRGTWPDHGCSGVILLGYYY